MFEVGRARHRLASRGRCADVNEFGQLFGFLPDGSGKALSLTRTVSTPLPGATNCLNNVPTSSVFPPPV